MSHNIGDLVLGYNGRGGPVLGFISEIETAHNGAKIYTVEWDNLCRATLLNFWDIEKYKNNLRRHLAT